MKKYLRELYQRRDLIFYLVASNLRAQHKNAVLGYFWWLLDPLLGVLIYYFVVVVVFRRGGEGYGAYLVVGLIVWRWLGTTVTIASHAIVRQAPIITQVYLPKIVFPVTVTLSELINFGFGLLVIALTLPYWGILPGGSVLWLPNVVLMQLLFSMALASVIAYISVFLPDMDRLLTHLMRLWFFASPVIWTEAMIPEGARGLLEINPMAHFLIAYRGMLIDNRSPESATPAGDWPCLNGGDRVHDPLLQPARTSDHQGAVGQKKGFWRCWQV